MKSSANRKPWLGILPLITAFAITTLALIGCESAIYHGKIAVKGNEPFAYVALVEKSGREFTIVGQLKTEIRERYQGLYLKVRAKILNPESSTAVKAGMPIELEVLAVLEVRNKPF